MRFEGVVDKAKLVKDANSGPCLTVWEAGIIPNSVAGAPILIPRRVTGTIGPILGSAFALRCLAACMQMQVGRRLKNLRTSPCNDS
jgi:hypothetical protein